MDLDTFIITVFDRLEDTIPLALAGQPLRKRGPAPTLTDSEVLTIETVGAFLGLEEETEIYAYFRRHYTHFFPGIQKIDRSTFVRQIAHLWKLKEAVWQYLLDRATPLPAYVIADSLPVPVCRFARAPRCVRFRGQADYGHDWVDRNTFYGFRLHALIDPEGFIRCMYLTPADTDEKDALEDMTEGKCGRVLGDRNYWAPKRTAGWVEKGVKVIAPFKHKSRDPHPRWSAFLSGLRYRIETVYSQFTQRFKVKEVKARDTWHLASRLLRCVLSHTLSLLIYRENGGKDLQLAILLSC
ncbi:MAG: IS982 family transposase [Armatimonadetes bacterium]|nr:IS982 family transposase [Armatimonadota bacterium]